MTPSSVLANWAQAWLPTRLSVMRTTPRTTLLPIDMRSSGFVPGSNKRVARHFLAYQIYLCQGNSIGRMDARTRSRTGPADGTASGDRETLGTGGSDEPLIEHREGDGLAEAFLELETGPELQRIGGAERVPNEKCPRSLDDGGRELDERQRAEVLPDLRDRAIALPGGEGSFAAA